jgi:multidrug efflux pump subunit AcrB
MWIVKLALRRPYTFIVAALLLLIISPVVILRTPTDIFPNINIPVVSIVWQYTGLSPHQFEGNITWPYERSLTTTVNDIEHIESQTMNGISVVKVFFQPNAQLPAALAQVTAISQTVLKSMPAGVTPPLVISYNASSVPVLQLGLSSTKLSEQQLNDIAMNFVRPQLATVPGAAIPWPYGGKIRQIMVDIDPSKLNGYGLSPTDITNAINAENLVLPSGTAKIGSLEYDVEMNGSPPAVDDLNNLPIKTVNGTVIYVRDVAHVRDGFQVQTNIVRQDGQRGSLLSAYKTGGASTLDIVSQVKAALPRIAASLPPELRIQPLFDQSLFVRAAVEGVIKEAVIAACLTAMMILLFPRQLAAHGGDRDFDSALDPERDRDPERARRNDQHHDPWRPGARRRHPGGRCHRHHREHRPQPRRGEGTPRGHPRWGGPDRHAGVCLDALHLHRVRADVLPRGRRALPVRAAGGGGGLRDDLLLRAFQDAGAHAGDVFPAESSGCTATGTARGEELFRRVQQGFERGFERLREAYGRWLEACLRMRWKFIGIFLALCMASLLLMTLVGQDFFPDGGRRAVPPAHAGADGTRIEETARMADLVEQTIRKDIPPGEITSILDNLGLPYSGINTSYSNNGTIGTADAEILVSLNCRASRPHRAVRGKAA